MKTLMPLLAASSATGVPVVAAQLPPSMSADAHKAPKMMRKEGFQDSLSFDNQYWQSSVRKAAGNRAMVLEPGGGIEEASLQEQPQWLTNDLAQLVTTLSGSWIGDAPYFFNGLTSGSTQCTAPDHLKTFAFTADEVRQPFQSKQPVTFIRWGDGDFYCALDVSFGVDSNGVSLAGNTEMCRQLKKDLLDYGSDVNRDKNLWVVAGNWWLCAEVNRRLHDAVDSFFANRTGPWGGFADGASAGGFYFPFVPAKQGGRERGVLPLLQGRVVSLVGPPHLGKLGSMLNYSSFVHVPPHSCWQDRGRIAKEVLNISAQHPGESVVFIVAGGVAARTLIYRLHKSIGHKDSLIDVGASLDGFAGVGSRDYNRDLQRFCKDYPEYVAQGTCD